MPDPNQTDLEMLADQMHGQPVTRPAAQGIADMESRIQSLKQQKANVLNHFNSPDAEKRLDEINRQLCEAESRLTEYQTQLQGLN